MRKSIAVIILLTTGVSIVFALYVRSLKTFAKKNGFTRIFKQKVIADTRKIHLKENSYYFAGLSSHYLYLGLNLIPDYLIRSDYQLSDTSQLQILIPNTFKAVWTAGRIFVDSPQVYLTERLTPTILTGDIKGQGLNKQLFFDKNDYLSIEPISLNSLITRQYNNQHQYTLLSKATLHDDQTYKVAKNYPLSQQGTDKFSTDGMLIYSSKNAMLIYVYYYTNQFVVLDTNLNVRFLMRSIDTVTIPKFTVDTIPSRHSITLSSPPKFINSKAAAYGHELIILSPSMADNEKKDQFDKNLVFDIYDLLSKTYLHSFYIPRSGRQRVKDIRWTGNCLYLLFENSLVSYTIR